MDHGENQKEIEDPQVVRWNRTLGLILFAVYALIYAAYVLTNTFAPSLMDSKLMFEVNNAILSGFGLIVGAIVIAFIYGVLCRSTATNSAGKDA